MFLLLSISVISAAVIGYEILLMRLFSIIQWHHFAYMIISLALLGFGASGTFLALAQSWLQPRFAAAFVANAAAFGLSTVGSFALAQRVPFNPLEVVWDCRQLLYLLELYLLLFIPFFGAANCIGLTFARFTDQIGRIYRFDLLGAGTGALGIVLALFAFSPTGCLQLLGTLGFFAAALASLDRALAQPRWRAGVWALCGLALPLAWPQDWLALRPSEYKGLSQALRVPGAEVLSDRSSPLGQLTVVRSPTIPFRYAPGLSLNCFVEPPPQLGVFTDGDSLSVITRYDGQREPLAYLDFLSSALPYHLLQQPRVLILGAGGGMDVLLARYHQATSIDAVELNPQVVDLVRRDYADFAGPLFDAPGVRVHVAEARGFVARSRDRYDLIQVALLDSFSASAAGVYALSESYLYTVEALQEYLRHLRPGGLLAITRWLKLPPRDSLKLFATAVSALERSGATDPGRRLALIRSWQTTTLVVKNGDLTVEDIQALRAFCDERSFDVAYYPGMAAVEANRYNLLDEPYLFEGAMALLSDQREDFLRRYKFYLAPATDDRPYFFHFFKWRVLPELLALRGQGGMPLVEWGYLILIATLLQAAAASLGLILLPLWTLRRSTAPPRRRGRVGFYFLALGLAFLFIEIAFIQRFILFLSHPLYAVAVVLCAFLVFAGLGSGYSARLAFPPPPSPPPRADEWGRLEAGATFPGRPHPSPPPRANQPRPGSETLGDFPVSPSLSSPITLAVTGIVLLALLYLFLLPPLFRWLMPLPDTAKILLSLVLIAPLAFCMGMPFPLGLARVAAEAPDWIPWAWGINGCASVLSAILATILAIHGGFTVVVGLAAGLYVLAAASLRERL